MHQNIKSQCRLFLVTFHFCWFAGCLPCPWWWSRLKLARSWSLLREEADSCSDWPSAARFCPSSSHTCSTRQESWRFGNILFIMTWGWQIFKVASFYHPLSLPSSGTVQTYPSSEMRSYWVRSLFQLILHIFSNKWHSESKWSCHLSEPFMSLLLVLSHTEFKLAMEVRGTSIWNITLWNMLSWLSNWITTSGLFMQNCSFLDESWLLPVKKTVNIVQ